MPKKTSVKEEFLIDILLNHPKGQEVRKTARDITDIVFQIRSQKIFKGLIEEAEFKEIKVHFDNFRSLVKNLIPDAVLPLSDMELYMEILTPLITRQIDRSA